ncbi:MAG: hypothetical protein GEU95_01590 [Rhizobiales bacterium]|nr:hypothetical protein [Hyphomicrobiales bacterium]
MSFTRLLTSTAAFAISAAIANAADMPVKAPPFAPPVVQQASGYVEVYGGWATTKFRHTLCVVGATCREEAFDFDGWVLGGAGRGNYWINPSMSVQLDVQAEGTSYKLDNGGPFSSNFSNHSYLIGGHINWRNSQSGLLGLFAGAGDAGGGFREAQRHIVVGGEGQLYWNQLTLYLQGGYDTVLGTPANVHVNAHAWFVRGTGRYFFTPNTLLEGTVLYANGEVEYESFIPASGSTNGFETWLWEAKLEHRFATTPFSLFAKYRGSDTKFDPISFGGGDSDELKITDHRVLVGLKLFMGQDTLRSNDRDGATLDIIDPLSIQTGPLMIGGTQALRP